MSATAPMPASTKKPQVQKEDAMWLQKEMINANYHELATARERGQKVAATFVPGNLNELLMCFDFAVCPRPTRCRMGCARNPAR